MQGDWKAAFDHVKIGTEYKKKVNWGWVESLGWCCMGYAKVMLGDFEDGVAFSKKGIKPHQKTGVEAYLSIAHIYSGLANKESGNLAEALEKVSRKNNEKNVEARSLIEMGGILVKIDQGDYQRALDLINQGMDVLKVHNMKS